MILGLAAAAAFVLILLTPAGATFRLMGLGGGIPITVLAKLYNPGSGSARNCTSARMLSVVGRQSDHYTGAPIECTANHKLPYESPNPRV